MFQNVCFGSRAISAIIRLLAPTGKDHEAVQCGQAALGSASRSPWGLVRCGSADVCAALPSSWCLGGD